MSKEASRPTDADLTNEFNSRKQELTSIVSKMQELEHEVEEHLVVIDSLSEANKLDPKRKCFRLVGGVLVERTVQEVLPQLQQHEEGIKKIMGQLGAQYKKKDSEFSEFVKKYNIQIIKQ